MAVRWDVRGSRLFAGSDRAAERESDPPPERAASVTRILFASIRVHLRFVCLFVFASIRGCFGFGCGDAPWRVFRGY